ncbi:hypothetical protein NUW58_g10151 [Xylaria curta]|uniref:Uncharacterized protein n=1 Tax=Xylaria curta TaxID=42375 RepID=A0ACC1MQE3_9PEZI|nr:hypothetical protein NUW58_g10151 [Xylaria curta]
MPRSSCTTRTTLSSGASSMANEKFDPTVKNVNEQKSDIQTLNTKLMRSTTNTASSQKAGKSSSSRSTPVSSNGIQGASEGSEAGSPGSSRHLTHDQALPGHDGNQQSDEEDDDEYIGGTITMLDNDDLGDGELTMIEPLSIDDEC